MIEHWTGGAVDTGLTDTEILEAARRVMGASKVVPLRIIWDGDFEWRDEPDRPFRSIAEFTEAVGPRRLPTYTVDRYGGTFSITKVHVPRWKAILLGPWWRWQAWRFDRRTG